MLAPWGQARTFGRARHAERNLGLESGVQLGHVDLRGMCGDSCSARLDTKGIRPNMATKLRTVESFLRDDNWDDRDKENTPPVGVYDRQLKKIAHVPRLDSSKGKSYEFLVCLSEALEGWHTYGYTSEKYKRTKFSVEQLHVELFKATRALAKVTMGDLYSSFARIANLESLDGGKSGAFVVQSPDKRFVVKTCTSSEVTKLNDIIDSYAHHVTINTLSLLIKLLGLFECKIGRSRVHFVIMPNVFGAKTPIARYDIKGSTDMRYVNVTKGAESTLVLKDTNFLRDYRPLVVKKDVMDLINAELVNDCNWLRDKDLYDFSMLICVYPPDVVLPPGVVSFEAYRKQKDEDELQKCIVAMGIIDILEQYNLMSSIRVGMQKLLHSDRSAKPPGEYAERFVKMLTKMVFVTEDLYNTIKYNLEEHAKTWIERDKSRATETSQSISSGVTSDGEDKRTTSFRNAMSATISVLMDMPQDTYRDSQISFGWYVQQIRTNEFARVRENHKITRDTLDIATRSHAANVRMFTIKFAPSFRKLDGIISSYVKHVLGNANSLLIKVLWLFQCTWGSSCVYTMVMTNISGAQDYKPTAKYVINGYENVAKDGKAKFFGDYRSIIITDDDMSAIVGSLTHDCNWLKENQLDNYSMLIVVYPIETSLSPGVRGFDAFRQSEHGELEPCKVAVGIVDIFKQRSGRSTGLSSPEEYADRFVRMLTEMVFVSKSTHDRMKSDTDSDVDTGSSQLSIQSDPLISTSAYSV
jgi:hypothetical protein